MSSPFRRRSIEREDEPAALTRLVRCVEVAPMQSLDDFARPSTPGGGDRDPRVSSSHGDRALYDSQLQVCAAGPSLCLQDCVRCASSMANPDARCLRARVRCSWLINSSPTPWVALSSPRCSVRRCVCTLRGVAHSTAAHVTKSARASTDARTCACASAISNSCATRRTATEQRRSRSRG